MITAFILKKLNEAGFMAYANFPAEKPDRPFTVVQRLEQARVEHIDAITLNLVSYAQSIYQADLQNERVKETMFALSEHKGISRVELGGGGNGENSDNQLWESESVFNITYYKEEFRNE